MNNTQRITISLPKYLYEDLVRLVPTGQVSSFVARAVEKKLTSLNTDPIDEFIEFQKRLPKKKKMDIMKAIEKGRR